MTVLDFVNFIFFSFRPFTFSPRVKKPENALFFGQPLFKALELGKEPVFEKGVREVSLKKRKLVDWKKVKIVFGSFLGGRKRVQKWSKIDTFFGNFLNVKMTKHVRLLILHFFDKKMGKKRFEKRGRKRVEKRVKF